MTEGSIMLIQSFSVVVVRFAFSTSHLGVNDPLGKDFHSYANWGLVAF